MATVKKKAKEPKSVPVTVKTHYIKNNDFRTVLATASWGGITMQGLININFCTDRITIPTQAVFSIEQGEGRQELKEKPEERQQRDGLIKEVHFGVLMDIQTAESHIKWLQNKIEELKKLQSNSVNVANVNKK
jgi:hypothetical protein